MTTPLTKPAVDLSRFHYYDVPPSFTAAVYITGTSYLRIAAATREEARAKVTAMIEAEDSAVPFDPLDEVDDVELRHVSANPTRFYLVTSTARASVRSTSRPEPDDEPRPPTENDQMSADRLGYVVSWKPEDVVGEGKA